MDKLIVKISPSSKELSIVENILKCPESNCQSVFRCTSNLRMHLVKHHKLDNGLAKSAKCANAQYCCPIKDCKYNKNSSKSFAKMKYLKQHYLKCHAPKEHACDKCEKTFSTQTMLNAHARSCGKNFNCTCGWKYSTKEALLTHCKRKGHVSEEDAAVIIDREKTASKERAAKREKKSPAKDKDKEECFKSSEEQGESMEEEDNTVVKVCIASPPHSRSPRKSSSDFPTHYIAAIALSELSTTFIIPKNCHIGVQTVDAKLGKKRSPNSDKKRKNSQETQTAGLTNKVKKKRICAETQTSSHLKRKVPTKVLTRRRKKSSETQTKHPMTIPPSAKPETVDINMFNDSSLSDSSVNEGQHKQLTMDDDSVWGIKSTSQSKPFITTINSNVFNINKELSIGSRGAEFPLSSYSNFDINKLCNNETQTELDCLLQNEGEGTSTTETQTTEELMGELLYSNTCTQTCGDVNELFDFNFVDIETQTAWPDL